MVPPSSSRDSVRILRESLEKDPAVVYWLDGDLRIVHCNEAWDRFAAENGGKGLERERQVGRCVMDVVPAPLKRYCDEGYEKVLSTGRAWEHHYECSSASLIREMGMEVHQVPTEGGGMVVVTSIRMERLRADESGAADAAGGIMYADGDGITTMCCHCRKTKRVNQSAIWDWVPAHVEDPPVLISHGLCSICMRLHYMDGA